jgi:hypothetical protein
MATDLNPTQIAAATTLTGAERIVVEQSGLDKTITPNQIRAFSAAAKFRYGGVSGAATEGTITPAGLALLDDADAASQRATLGLGTAATSAATAFATEAQGAKADTAIQPATGIDVGDVTNITAAPAPGVFGYAKCRLTGNGTLTVTSPGAGVCASMILDVKSSGDGTFELALPTCLRPWAVAGLVRPLTGETVRVVIQYMMGALDISVVPLGVPA